MSFKIPNAVLGWHVMCILSGLLWLVVKAFVTAQDRPRHETGWRKHPWYLWPGTCGKEFFGPESTVRVRPAEWNAGAAYSITGVVMIWMVTPMLHGWEPMVAIWVGMVGFILMLHFGLFSLLANVFRIAGINARPIMDAPLMAGTTAEFWGRRWNRGFSDPARRYIFRPLVRRSGITVATFAVYLVSGFVHELVISVPAGAGFGLPTAYFIFQWIAVMAERRIISPGLRRLFAIAVILLPVGLLFHSSFTQNVMLPFLQAVGAIER